MKYKITWTGDIYNGSWNNDIIYQIEDDSIHYIRAMIVDDSKVFIISTLHATCEEEAILKSQNAISKLEAALMLKYNILLKEVFISSIHPSTTGVIAKGRITLTNNFSYIIDQNEKENFSKVMSDLLAYDSIVQDSYYVIFKTALLSSSPTTTFITLYSLLLLKIADETNEHPSQSKVDTFIEEQTDVYDVTKNIPSTRGNRDETLYTWLRNQIAHTQSNTDISSIDRQIELNLLDFIKIVKKKLF